MPGRECYSVSVSMIDWSTQRSTTHVNLGPDITGGLSDKSDNLVKMLEKYSYAKAIRRSDTEYQDLYVDISKLKATEKGYDRVNAKAIIIMKNEDRGMTHRIAIPAPKKDLFDTEGEVTAKKGQEIATAFTKVLGGQDCYFIKGYFYAKKELKNA